MIEQIKAALYVRLSQEDRNKLHPEDNSESINNQIMLLKSRCEKEGWIIYDIYNDDDFSGSDRQRPEFNRMIEDARLHKFDVLLCKTQSRFCRDLELVEHYLNYMFPVWNIRFLSIIDNADTSNRQNRKARQINGLIDQWYLEDISENVKAVLSAKRKKGEWVGSQAPYGYAKSPEDKHKLIIDEPAAKIVRYIYRLYINGLGYASIVRRLNDEQIPPPAKYKNLKEVSSHKKTATRGLWCYYTIQKILSSQVYIGNTVQGKSEKLSYKGEERRYKPQSEWDIVENTHDAIVSYDTWHKAQIIRSTRSTPYKQDMKNTVFSRMCKCVYCGATLNKHTYHNSPMLECPTKHIKTGICPGCVITVKRLEEIVIDEIKDHCQRLMDVSAVKSKIDSNVEINNRRQEFGLSCLLRRASFSVRQPSMAHFTRAGMWATSRRAPASSNWSISSSEASPRIIFWNSSQRRSASSCGRPMTMPSMMSADAWDTAQPLPTKAPSVMVWPSVLSFRRISSPQLGLTPASSMSASGRSCLNSGWRLCSVRISL